MLLTPGHPNRVRDIFSVASLWIVTLLASGVALADDCDRTTGPKSTTSPARVALLVAGPCADASANEDVRLLGALLTVRGFRVRTLSGACANSTRLLEAFDRHLLGAGGAVALFYFVGEVGQIEDDGNDEKDGFDERLRVAPPGTGWMRDDQLRSRFEALGKNTAAAVVVDAAWPPPSLDGPVSAGEGAPWEGADVGRSILVVSGGRGQSGGLIPGGERSRSSAFGTAFRAALRVPRQGPLTVRELLEEVIRQLRGQGESWTPMVFGRTSFNWLGGGWGQEGPAGAPPRRHRSLRVALDKGLKWVYRRLGDALPFVQWTREAQAADLHVRQGSKRNTVRLVRADRSNVQLVSRATSKLTPDLHAVRGSGLQTIRSALLCEYRRRRLSELVNFERDRGADVRLEVRGVGTVTGEGANARVEAWERPVLVSTASGRGTLPLNAGVELTALNHSRMPLHFRVLVLSTNGDIQVLPLYSEDSWPRLPASSHAGPGRIRSPLIVLQPPAGPQTWLLVASEHPLEVRDMPCQASTTRGGRDEPPKKPKPAPPPPPEPPPDALTEYLREIERPTRGNRDEVLTRSGRWGVFGVETILR